MAVDIAIETDPVEELAGRIFTEGVGTFHLFNVYLGVRLGLYRKLSQSEPLDAAGLAAATGLDPWYVREWLQAEQISGLVQGDGDDPSTARFRLSPRGARGTGRRDQPRLHRRAVDGGRRRRRGGT